MSKSESYKILLEISKKDLTASELLYINNHYLQAVFSLQQSVEKAVKSIAVFAGDVQNPSKEIGHNCANYYKINTDKFKQKIDRFENNDETTEVLCRIMGFDNSDLTEDLQGIKEEVNSLEDVIHSVIKKPFTYQFISDADMLDITSKLKEIYLEFNYVISDDSSFFSSEEEFELFKMDMVNKIRNASEFLIDKYQEEGKYLVENAHELIEDGFKTLGALDKDFWNTMGFMIIQMNYAVKSLYCLSLITDAHAVSSRYPMNDFNPIEFYTSDLPIIKNFDFLIYTAGNIIEAISCVYEEHDILKNQMIHKNKVESSSSNCFEL
jgi:hypothetical protein